MTAVHAMWVDGTAVRAQREGYFTSVTMGGKGATFRSHTEPGTSGEWFQWAIPTPVLLNSERPSIKKVFVLYSTVGTAKITAVHVYDAAVRIASFDGLGHSGDHGHDLDPQNTWAITANHPMKFGLGISVLVDFGPASPNGVPAVTFYSAGADFVTP